MSRDKRRNTGNNVRLEHLQSVPYLLAVSLFIVYVLGMGSLYLVKGFQAADSLNISYDYDMDAAVEYSYIEAVLDDLEGLRDIAENKSGSLDAYTLIAEIDNIDNARDCVEMGLTLIGNVEKEEEKVYGRAVKMQQLVSQLNILESNLYSFLETVTTAQKECEKQSEKKNYKDLEKKLENAILNIEAFIEVAALGKNLMEDGNLATVKVSLQSLDNILQPLNERVTESANLLLKASVRMKDDTSSLVQGLMAQGSQLKAASKGGSQKLEDFFTENAELEALLTELALKNEVEENVLAAETVAGNINNLNLRKRLSRDVLENSEHLSEAANDVTYILRNQALAATVTSGDGKILWSVLPDSELDTDAWNNLIGTDSFSDFDGNTRWVLDNYKEDLFPEISYSVTHGFEIESESLSDVHLTVLSDLQEKMYQYLSEHGVVGDVLCYDYETGEILCMASTLEGWNYSMRVTSPGSTMKIVTLFLLEASGVDVNNLYYTCSGSWENVSCTSENKTIAHGSLNGADAIGMSCNCWFAQAINDKLMENGVVKDYVKDILKELGYQVAETENEGTQSVFLGKIRRIKSKINLIDGDTANSYWNLIGETTVEMSPIDMVQLAGLYAGGGITMQAKLVSTDDKVSINLKDKYGAVLNRCLSVWKSGYELKYGNTYEYLDQNITAAKTGTTQISNDKDEQRLLLGYSEEMHVAFYIIFNNYKVNGVKVTEENVTLATIANYLFDLLKEIGR